MAGTVADGNPNPPISDAIPTGGIFDAPGGPDSINPADLRPSGGSDDGTGPRRRGRPPGGGRKSDAGSDAKPSAAQQKVDITGLEQILFSIHMMLAMSMKAPELALAPEEAASLAKAAAAVQKHYPSNVSAKAVAWTNLAIVGAGIYGPRVVAITMRHKAQENSEKTDGAGNVVNYPGQVRT